MIESSGSNDAARFERACEWFMELREQPESQDTVAHWLEWCRADPANREAFERAREVWQLTEGAQLANLGATTHRASFNRKRATWGAAIAAALALTAFSLQYWGAAREASVTFTTHAAENRSERLPDGSSVVLGGDSRVLAHFDRNGRRLILERGEAYFNVARDRARPFVVSVGHLRLTALGTAFNVRTSPGRVVVAVSEGVVAVEPPASLSGTQSSTRLIAGQEVSVDVAAEQLRVGHIEPSTVASWQRGRLQFAREPLSSVVASVNRYSARKVVLQGAELGEMRFTGTVFAGRVDDWLRGLPTVFPITVSGAGANVVITSRPAVSPAVR